jgi:hypothetical protein
MSAHAAHLAGEKRTQNNHRIGSQGEGGIPPYAQRGFGNGFAFFLA